MLILKENQRISVADIITRPSYAYVLCGWHTRSDIPLTNVSTSALDGKTVNIHIQLAPGNSPLAESAARSDWAIFEHSTERSLIGIENVAAFEVIRGERILVWPATGAAKKDIELFLFGPVWATLCHQRGIWPLHASGIMTKKGIVAFAGHSGVGKSTTAAFMGCLGYELVTDDILPVSFSPNAVPGAWPYLRRLKLQSDPITKLALRPTQTVSETLDKEKYFVLPEIIADDKWTRIERIYLLEIGPKLSIERITGTEAVRAIIEQTYHFRFVVESRRFREHLGFCAKLVSRIPVYRLRRPPSRCIEEELPYLICAHLEEASS